MAKLKVFTWSDGFHAHTVAAASRPKALEAWGMQQDIFKTGLATEIDSGPAYEAALKSPGEVVQRGEAVDKGAIGKAPKMTKPQGPTKAQKEKVAVLEAELERLDEEQGAALADLDAEMERLQAKRQTEEGKQKKDRSAIVAKLKAARDKL